MKGPWIVATFMVAWFSYVAFAAGSTTNQSKKGADGKNEQSHLVYSR